MVVLCALADKVDIVTTNRSAAVRPLHPVTPLCFAIDITTTPLAPLCHTALPLPISISSTAAACFPLN